jgi:large subunit ribosomal protein L29
MPTTGPTTAELRELDDDELQRRAAEFRRELFNLRFQMATGQLDDPTRLGKVRRNVARVLTLMREREIAEVEDFGYEPGAFVAVGPRVTEDAATEETDVEADDPVLAAFVADEDEVTDDEAVDDGVDDATEGGT